MMLQEKIVKLRKANNWSQEELSERLNVSRQAVSRWESGTALPDADNILRLSKLLGVSADYLLNDEYESDNDLPKVKQVKKDNLNQIMIVLITLEVIAVIFQFVSTFVMKNILFTVLSFVPFVAIIGGFEYTYRKNKKPVMKQSNTYVKNSTKFLYG